MLHSLYIQNFALIEKVTLDFSKGFTVITGETGSGKSILLGALHLILGDRADYSVIRNKEEKTVVEAVFKIRNFDLDTFFTENELDFNEETIVRREISAQGKSRAFINDTPVQLSVLKELAERLIHIHSQHHTIDLKNMDFQMELLDVLGDTLSLKNEFNTLFTAYKSARLQLNQKEETLKNALLNADYVKFQLDELEKLDLINTNFQEIENELKAIENNEDIKLGFSVLIDQLTDEGGATNALNQLIHVKTKLDKIAGIYPQLDVLSQRFKETYLEFLDIGQEAISNLDDLEVYPAQKELLTGKIDLFNSVLRKHNALNQEELMEIYSNLSTTQLSVEELELEITAIKNTLKLLEVELTQKAEVLHETRVSKALGIQNQLIDLLVELKLPHTQIVFDLAKTDKFSVNGFTDMKLLFSPNKGMIPLPIERAASGGELSRVMLAFQYLISAKKQLPTLIFDEIDTGVSGEVAQKIGNILHKMGDYMQIFAITHLPQVAGKGQNHLKVSKSHETEITTTEVLKLSKQERIEEIARLMSGDNINKAALENAKALMN
jgi:DNA repair protein RecN (Recombination protein N)